MWFPRPSTLCDIELVSVGGVDLKSLYALLSDPKAVEWREKVGVVGAVDGSAKMTTRLLLSGKWVLKTNLASAVELREELVSRQRQIATKGIAARLWHPDKTWAVFNYENLWHSLNATVCMSTLRTISGTENKMRAWTAMLDFAVGVALKDGIGLDLNPSNFGESPGDDRLYYLDDEWYPSLGYAELGSAVVARIPEEPEIGVNDWENWGRVLATVLDPVCGDNNKRGDLLDNVARHPLVATYEENRAGLLKGLGRIIKRRRRRSVTRPSPNRSRARSTAVIADVHGNIDALDAVLGECRENGIDSFLFLGDAVGYGPNPKECVQRLAELPNAQYVRGNHDHWIGTGVLRDGMSKLARYSSNWTLEQLTADERSWLASLPVEVMDSKWLAVHGAPKDPRRFFAYVYELTYEDNLEHLCGQQMQLCFCGHTHVQFIHEKSADGRYRKLGTPKSLVLNEQNVLLVNPGSIGQPRDKDTRAAYAVWDKARNRLSLHRTRYDVAVVVDKIHRLGLPEGLADRLVKGA